MMWIGAQAVAFLLLFFAGTANAYMLPHIDLATPRQLSSSALHDSRKDMLKDEQYRIQQEMLARRKDKTRMKQYFEEVEEKRKIASKESKEKIWATAVGDKKDPLNKWKEAKMNGKINPLGYEPEPSKSDSKLGVNIVIPLNPIGMPRYDNGERFDLRLPYAERGYEDPSADVIGNLWGGIKKVFGGDKKSSAGSASAPAEKKDDASNQRKKRY